MLNARGDNPLQGELSTNFQEVTPINRTHTTFDHQKQLINQNPSKRYKGGDDSFEQEHRLVTGGKQYFHSNNNRSTTSSITAPRTTTDGSTASRQPTFPPFRINFLSEEVPSELTIIKEINKHSKISLSYGRYVSTGDKKCFLLYANSNDQFERLLNKSTWPSTISSFNYSIVFPSKVPSSYSIIAVGIPPQWNLTEFETDIKKQYPSIIKVERMLVRGGIPIAKVRIDFSSNNDVQKILKDKRLLLDDENTSFAVQQYSPPLKVLRCFNCQQYNDHIAANCPHKDKPTCFRCGQNHPYNPNCTNKICCANCKEEHLAGNPSCRVKIEERKKCKMSIPSPNENQLNTLDPYPAAWTVPFQHIFNTNTTVEPHYSSTATSSAFENPSQTSPLDISKKLDLILFKIDNIQVEYDNLKTNLFNLNQQFTSCQETIGLLKEFITDKMCPLILEVGEGITGKKQDINKKKLRPLITSFNQGLISLSKSIDINSSQLSTLKKSSSYESISEDI